MDQKGYCAIEGEAVTTRPPAKRKTRKRRKNPAFANPQPPTPTSIFEDVMMQLGGAMIRAVLDAYRIEYRKLEEANNADVQEPERIYAMEPKP